MLALLLVTSFKHSNQNLHLFLFQRQLLILQSRHLMHAASLAQFYF